MLNKLKLFTLCSICCAWCSIISLNIMLSVCSFLIYLKSKLLFHSILVAFRKVMSMIYGGVSSRSQTGGPVSHWFWRPGTKLKNGTLPSPYRQFGSPEVFYPGAPKLSMAPLLVLEQHPIRHVDLSCSFFFPFLSFFFPLFFSPVPFLFLFFFFCAPLVTQGPRPTKPPRIRPWFICHVIPHSKQNIIQSTSTLTKGNS